jgi:lipopolysaccharide biosynthesis glycosyltransferase
MKIGVCTLAVGDAFKDGSKLCVKSITDYCAQHQYDLIMDESVVDSREPYWNKVLLLEKYLRSSTYDYLVWIDADMMIMNPSITLEYLIVNYVCDKEMLLAIDCGDQINTGFWIVKNSDYCRTVLKLIFNLPELCGDYHEQGVLNQLYNKNVMGLKERCEIIPEIESRLVNASMTTFHWGDLLIHFLGIRNPSILLHVTQQFAPFPLQHETPEEFQTRMHNLRAQYIEGVANPRYIASPPRVKIAFCSIFAGDKYTWGDRVNYGLRSIQEYCRKKGYDCIIKTESLDSSLPPHFSKMLLALDLLSDCRYHYVVWIDADIMIMNQKIDFTKFIEDNMGTNDMMLSRDISGHINTGMWVIRNTEASKTLLHATYKLTELRDRKYEDQDVFNQIYNRNLFEAQSRCKIFPADQQHLMNCCVGLFEWEYFLIHFMSLSKEGLQEAYEIFYPDRKDNESQLEFQHRLQFIINYRK